MKIYKRFITAEGAAREFAETAFDDKREVGCILLGNGQPNVMLFQLDGGTKWYAVRFLPNYAGWEVVPELNTASAK